jgi:hypothetical protein
MRCILTPAEIASRPSVPWRKKFHFRLWRSHPGWCFEVYFGLVSVDIFRNYGYEEYPGIVQNGLKVCFIPPCVVEGGLMPTKEWVFVKDISDRELQQKDEAK